MKHTLRLAAAALAAVALAMLGTTVPTANAADPSPIIDPDAAVTLNIHKYLGQTATAGDGTVQDMTGRDWLSGVKFDVYQVADAGVGGTCPSTAWVDLTTNAGWDAAATLNGYVPPQGAVVTSFTYPDPGGHTYCLGTLTRVTTSTSDGTATFPHTGPGLFLVYENLSASTNVQKNGTGTAIDTSVLSPSAPFLVTLPMTDPVSQTSWMYDVHVYPKNQADTVTKTVTDQGTALDPAATGASHTITYTITSSISDQAQDMYRITDTLDTRLTNVNVTVKIDVPAPDGPITLDEGTDYDLTGNFVISNTAYVIPNQAWYDNHYTPEAPGIPSGQVQSKYGSLTITKKESGTSTLVPGAGFTLYKAGEDQVCTSADLTAGNVIFPERFTSDPGGTLTFTGLQLSNFYDGFPAGMSPWNRYCLVETTAPTGYNLLAEPILITIDTAGDVQALDVPNQKKNLGNALPLTGGQGVAVLSIGGALLVGAGLGYYLVFLRRHRNAQ
jgi:fimbrial isopeptide formation D2 family protein/LPXTG-motif cell wall-anchored protein